MDAVKYQLVTQNSDLDRVVQQMQNASLIAFDTEFVSEDCYQPELCLIQVWIDGQIFLLDPLMLGDTTAFWRQLADGSHTTLAHAAREEFRFCQRYTGRGPANLVDTQVAAALVALEYPAAYSTLVSRFAGRTISKGETRTNWRKRPLADSQLEYAASDVYYLPRIFTAIQNQLEKRKRQHWLDEEMQAVSGRYQDAVDEERWRRVSGISSLQPRELAIIRNLYQWRQETAQTRNHPLRRVLRDDLMIEIARLKSDQALKVRSIRGMNFSRHSNDLNEIAHQVGQALQLTDEQLPRKVRSEANYSKLSQVIQFSQTALGIVCRREQVAPALVGTTQDLRELIAWSMGEFSGDQPPLLDRGWRKEVVGEVITDLLAGKVAIKITNPKAEFPLEFDHR
ncbi:MAG: HRDC domain-containing protein [Planctomycetaceae bacterium]|nr:HRDC domain-containing protein [Planctomycetaceae bacterium]